MTVAITNLESIRTMNDKDPAKWPKLWEVLSSLAQAIPVTNVPPPPPVKSINVAAQDGIFHVTLMDSGPVQSHVNYFAEYDTDPNFTNPHVIDLGSSRETRQSLGNQMLYWRGYNQYKGLINSQPTPPIVFAGAVSGGGGATGPALPRSTGSGTAPNSGQLGGSGAGKVSPRPKQYQ